ncbi:hypothetical protein HDU96_009574 [Phlyctochytrium bullatum]|nr:hypothetical protein HDU96_009574 [Phlyctochytrium bullatum]
MLARKVIDHAGLSDKIKIFVGPFNETYGKLKEEEGVDTVDIFFIDHVKSHYLSDFKLIETHKMVKTGSIVVADNVITPGAPDYLDYVSVDKPGDKPQSSIIATHKLVMTTLEYSTRKDGVSIATVA